MPETYQTAAAYIRVSTEEQTELSPDAQLHELQRYAAANRLLLDPAHVYVDAGISGRSAAKRPAFQAMIANAKHKDHPFDVILVHKFDRFARSREDSIVYKSLLSRIGVQVISITESFDDGGSGMGMLLESITEAYAEYYSVNLGREVKKGMTEKARRGQLQSTPSYGYRLEDHKLVPNPPEDFYVRQLFSRYLDGACLFELAKWMNAEGQRTHRGNPFENRTVEYILRNPVYIGKLRWNPAGRTHRHYDDPNLIIADSTHPPLVTQDQWDRAQQRIAETKAKWTYHKKPASQRHHWLCGVVRCASCGTTLIWSAPHYMKCNNYVRGRCRTSQHVHIELLESAFLAQLRHDAAQMVGLDFQVDRQSAPPTSEAARARADLATVDRKLSRIRDAYQSGIDTLEEYAAAKAALLQQRQQLEAVLRAADPDPTPAQLRERLHERILATIRCLEDPTQTVAQKYEAASSLCATSTWSRSTSTLTLTYRLTL